jgi:polyvinyl alcohol dehydrogenase (cytochrome)
MRLLRKPAGRTPVRHLSAAAVLVLALSACAPDPSRVTAGMEHASVADDAHPGKATYEQWCASCHDAGATSGAPSLEAIRTLNRATIRYALELGYMKIQAKDVPRDELAQLIDWLPRDEGKNDDWVETARCAIKLRRVKLDGAPRTAIDFGIGDSSNRSQTKAETGLAKADMPNLELAWAVAFPQTPTMRAQPVIVGDTLFLATTDAGRLYAMDTNTGCVKWVYASDMTLRSSLAFADATDRNPALILMGDAAGKVHAVNAITGAKAWIADIKLNELNRITGAPVVNKGRVFVPLSAIEVNYAGEDDYECCKGQGAMVALDLATGKQLWVGRTMADSEPVRLSRTGTQQWGPSGAIIWSTPVLDPKRNQLYAGTGENTSWPATDTSDAIIAYDLDTGAKKWVFQATKADIWNYACGRKSANCDWPGEYHSPDHDFGATSMLVKRQDGRELVIAGQKSGVVWALDPDNGSLVWSNKIGRGSANGGVHWGMAYADNRIFVPINDPGPGDNPNFGPGLHALNAMTGEIEWSYKTNARDCGADVPAAIATRPAPEWRITPISAPVLPPPPRVTAAPIARPAAPAPALTAPATGAPTAIAAAAPAAPAARPVDAPPARPPQRCRLGMSPAPLLVDGAVITGTTQGMLRIFDGTTGDVLFEYMTNKEFPQTVNGLEGHGGGLDSAPYVAGDGTLFVQSGYARFGEPPGNMLLAFKPKKES